MNDIETNKLREIMNTANSAAAHGNGECHSLYVMLRDMLDCCGDPTTKPLMIDGYQIPENIVSMIKDGGGHFVNGIREIRSLHGITLAAAKSIADQIRGN